MIHNAMNNSILAEANLTKHDVVFAMYKAVVTGWGYDEPVQVLKNRFL